MIGVRAALVSIAVLSIGCSGTPTIVIPMDLHWDGDFAAQIFDTTGLATGGRQLATSEWRGDGVTARPESNEVDVMWTGGACSHHPTVALSGTKDALAIKVANPTDFNPLFFLPVACPAVGLMAGITLELTQPVSADAIQFKVDY